MVDWNGLFNWSVKHHDGTAATRPDFEPMSNEDKKWLEDAMQQYTFNDADRLKEVSDELKKDSDNGFKNNPIELFEELQELIELHERSSLNLALCGGLETVLKYVLLHPNGEARIIACQTFN